MKFVTRIDDGRIAEPERSALAAHIRGRRSGFYRIEIKEHRNFSKGHRSVAHIWLRQLEQETGHSMEFLKAQICQDLDWGEWISWRAIDPDGEIVERQSFERGYTEDMDAETYESFIERIKYLGDFLGIRLETLSDD